MRPAASDNVLSRKIAARPPTQAEFTIDEIAALGTEVYARQVKPLLQPEDDGKLVVIDIYSGDFEVNDDPLTAADALRARRPEGEFWGERAGHPTVYTHVTPFILGDQ